MSWIELAKRNDAADKLFPPHPQPVGHSIDVVEPRCNESDLQNCFVVETRTPQAVMIIFPDFGSVFGKFDHVVQHRALFPGDGSGRVVPLQRFNQCFIQRYSAQKLCVGVDSIHAPVGDGYHCGDHFVLPATERQIGRHERAKSREGVVKRFRNQAVGGNDRRPTSFGGMHRRGVLLGIEQFLFFHRFAQLLIRLRKRNGADPRHKKLASTRGSCLTIRGQQTYIEAVWCANTQIVLVGLGGQIHLAEIPRAEDRVDEHRSVESAAPTTQAVVAGPAVLCVGRGVPGLG
jgi:hypothetical protein